MKGTAQWFEKTKVPPQKQKIFKDLKRREKNPRGSKKISEDTSSRNDRTKRPKAVQLEKEENTSRNKEKGNLI